MSFYDGLANTANNLIAKFGQAVTLHQSVPSGYAHGAATNTITNYAGLGVIANYTQKEIDGTRIQIGDVKLELSPFTTNGAAMPQPTSADTMTVGSIVYGVVDPVNVISPAGTVVLYEVQLRGK